MPGVKDKVELDLVSEYGAHPEIRVNGKKLSANYDDFDALKKALLSALGKVE